MFWKTILFTVLIIPLIAQTDDRDPEYSYEYHAEYAAAERRIDEYGDLCLHNISMSNSVCRYFHDEYRNMLDRLDVMPDHLIQNFSDPLIEWKILFGTLNNAGEEQD